MEWQFPWPYRNNNPVAQMLEMVHYILWKSVNGAICKRQASKYTVSITKHTRNSYQIQNFRACEKTSTLLSMSDNYVHCTMLFELILSLVLQSKETFCHLLVKCCQLLLVVICHSTKRTPLCNNVKFPVFTLLIQFFGLWEKRRDICLQAFTFVLKFLYCSSFCLSFLVLFHFFSVAPSE